MVSFSDTIFCIDADGRTFCDAFQDLSFDCAEDENSIHLLDSDGDEFLDIHMSEEHFGNLPWG